ncbi:MAG: holo-ACP synthase [Bacillota bacterium]
MLVEGIGTDIVEIYRIKNVVERSGDRFLTRVFTENELSMCLGRKNPYPCLAGRFAAKEAVFKALGTGLKGCSWTDVEVCGGGSSPPEIALAGNALKIAGDRGIDRVMVSISHGREAAVAFAMAVKGGVNHESCYRLADEGNRPQGHGGF